MSTSHFSVFNCLFHLLGCRCLKLVGWSSLDHRQRRHRRRVWQSSETELLTFFFSSHSFFSHMKMSRRIFIFMSSNIIKNRRTSRYLHKNSSISHLCDAHHAFNWQRKYSNFFFLSSLNAAVPPSRTEDDELALSVGILYWHSTCSLDTWYAVCRTGGTWRSTQFYRVGKYVEKNFSNILCFFSASRVTSNSFSHWIINNGLSGRERPAERRTLNYSSFEFLTDHRSSGV